MKKVILLALGLYSISLQAVSNSITANPKSNQVLIINNDNKDKQNYGTVSVVDIDSGKKLFTLKHPAPTEKAPSALEVSSTMPPKEKQFIKDLQERLQQEVPAIQHAVFTPSGNKIVTQSQKILKIWDAASGKELISLSETFEIPVLVLSTTSVTDDRFAALRNVYDEATKKTQRIIDIYDINTGKKLTEVISPTGLESINLSNDNKKLLTIGSSFKNDSLVKEALLWDAQSGQQISKLDNKNRNFVDAFFIQDGKKIVALSRKDAAPITESTKLSDVLYVVQVWDTDTQKIIFESDTGISDNFTEINKHKAITQDDTKIIVDYNKTAHLTDINTGKIISSIPIGDVIDLQLSPDGSKIIASTIISFGNIDTAGWSAEGKQLFKIKGLSSRKVFNYDGTKIITHNTDKKSINVLDANNGKLLSTIKY